MAAPDYRDLLPAPGPPKEGRLVSMAEAMAAIPDNCRVYVSPICSVPVALVAALAEHHDRWTHIELVTDYLIDPLPVFEFAGAPFHLTSLQPNRAAAAMGKAGVLARVPASYSQFARLIGPHGPHAIDVALVQVSPPGPEGRFSLGVAAGANADVVRTAPFVIAEINPNMPYTFGAAECERSLFDLLVDVEHPVVELVVPEPDDTARTIGAHAAAEVPDGAVLQFGIGAIPESILAQLGDRRDLGMHGGMVGDTVIRLVESGALTGARKSIDPGKMVVGGVLGTRRSFDWAHRNPDILTVGSQYSHGVPILAQVRDFCAINSALEIALDGSVNAEMAGETLVSGPGGQPDFAVGASFAPGGRSIIAFPATAAGGKLSRIVRRLGEGAVTTLPRYLVDRVVTEYGVARLAGLPIEQRAGALAAIAHPDFRAQLSA
ncbi:MAG: acetyl-CoA hydrolase/transferase family protein [Acidimicrobiales bacterium]